MRSADSGPQIWFPMIRGGSGTDVYTERLAVALQRRGLETQITCFPSCCQFFPSMLGSVRIPEGARIVHTNSWNGYVFHGRGLPSVTTDHLGLNPPDSGSYRNAIVRTYHDHILRPMILASIRTSTMPTGVSQYVASTFTAQPRTVRVIPNWVDVHRFVPSEEDVEHSGFHLLFVGNLTKRKGADLLKPLMAKLGPDFSLFYTSGLRTGTRSASARNMHPLGRPSQARLVKLFQETDALLFPSRLEGFGLVPLEAMACGKPVVASRNSAIGEVVVHGRTGLLCETGNVESFASACRTLAERPGIARRYGQAGRDRAVREYSEDTILPRYISLYEELVGA